MKESLLEFAWLPKRAWSHDSSRMFSVPDGPSPVSA
jgi:hypothetical protein